MNLVLFMTVQPVAILIPTGDLTEPTPKASALHFYFIGLYYFVLCYILMWYWMRTPDPLRCWAITTTGSHWSCLHLH